MSKTVFIKITNVILFGFVHISFLRFDTWFGIASQALFMHFVWFARALAHSMVFHLECYCSFHVSGVSLICMIVWAFLWWSFSSFYWVICNAPEMFISLGHFQPHTNSDPYKLKYSISISLSFHVGRLSHNVHFFRVYVRTWALFLLVHAQAKLLWSSIMLSCRMFEASCLRFMLIDSSICEVVHTLHSRSSLWWLLSYINSSLYEIKFYGHSFC